MRGAHCKVYKTQENYLPWKLLLRMPKCVHFFLFFLCLLDNLGVLQAASYGESALSLTALTDFKRLLNGTDVLPSWRNHSGGHLFYCTWLGVSCDRRGRGRVIGLQLPGLGLQGTITHSLANLTWLRTLDLSENVLSGEVPPNLPTRLEVLNLAQNHLHGEVPQSLSRLWRLQELSLNRNWFHGIIPAELANCTQIQTLNLAQNNLTGSIPAALGDHLPSLLHLLLWFNSLAGPLPPSLANCSQLIQLEISMNPNLNGHIPSEYGRLQQLVILRLFYNQLSGVLPPALGNCTELKDLSLFSNRLSGELPAMLGELSSLQVLSLQNNSFTGQIPRLLNCSGLVYMDLSSNAFTGAIPHELGAISFNAQYSDETYFPPGFAGCLNVHNNLLTGEIPSTLGNCSGLRFLFLNFNNLQGSIPKELGKLTNLQQLYMTGNQLTGHIPPTLGNLSHLEELFLDINSLNGTIPESFTNFANLSQLDLGTNQLEGTIPNQIGSLASLWYLVLLDNKLSGTVPPSLANCTQLQQLKLSINSLSGLLPPFLPQLPHLQLLDLSDNHFSGHLPVALFANATAIFSLSVAQNNITGPIPSVIGRLSSLQLLDLHANQFEGPIPSELSRCTNLDELDLQSNALQGPLPSDLGRLYSLRRLHLQWNALQGDIPDSLGNCHKLEDVDLSHNFFSGAIPTSLVTLPSLELNLLLSHNFLTGLIPKEVGNLDLIQKIDFSFNKLFGDIPATFADCSSLQALNLSNNRLNGTIPQALGELKNLFYLDLSANNLSGQIPAELAGLPELHFFNVSHNQLVGRIPDTTSFTNLTAASFSDNAGLCGPPLSVHCPMPMPKNISKWVIAAVVCSAFAVTLVLCGLFLWCNRSQLFSDAGQMNFFEDLLKTTSLRVTAEELEIATRGFNESNLLGSGGSSKVYKGILKDGQMVAVKRFDLENNSEEAERFFRKECETLGKIRHRNLVSILSTCCNLDMKALVLEYMPNGSLEDLLFGYEDFELDWEKIFNIALDVGKALVYLHHECSVPIIHRDLKPSNILLDENYMAHVADFGIAKLLSPETTTYTASYFQGSIGYIAPECAEPFHHSTKGDIYSYGVVLLCMLTGKQPTSELFDNGIDLSKWVRGFFPQRFLDALNHSLHAEVEAAECETEVLLFMKVALLCTAQDPSERPTSKQVVQELLQIRECRSTSSWRNLDMETIEESITPCHHLSNDFSL